MSDFLLELRCEEIPARMQAGARADLEKLFRKEMEAAGVAVGELTVWSTPRRLALIARGLPSATAAVSEEVKGPRVGAPPQALEGFLRKTGLSEDQLVERDGVRFAITEKPGRATADVLAEAVPAIVRAFPWPKSQRWGAASLSSESLRWVRPLSAIVSLLDGQVVECEVGGIKAGRLTRGHRFHSEGEISIDGVDDYAAKLRAAHVIVDQTERQDLVRAGAAKAATAAGLSLVEDEGLVIENAGLTEWPVPLLGRFDESYLDVPPEVIQLTARTNQKYFVCTSPLPLAGGGVQSHVPLNAGGPVANAAQTSDSPTPNPSRKREGDLANAFVCTANIVASDGGEAIVDGNRKVLAARLSDARFFWEQDRKTSLADQAKKLSRITFHEQLGTVADKVERVVKLAEWLASEGIVPNCDPALARQAAELCKADLVTEMVGEFPELQGLMGGYYARAEGLPDAVADAIRDHYKPVGQGDDVPTAPVTVAVSLADKLDTLVSFLMVGEFPTGSRDPFALRRATFAILSLILESKLRFNVFSLIQLVMKAVVRERISTKCREDEKFANYISKFWPTCPDAPTSIGEIVAAASSGEDAHDSKYLQEEFLAYVAPWYYAVSEGNLFRNAEKIVEFIIDRIRSQSRALGVRPDVIESVIAFIGRFDLYSSIIRARALNSLVESADGVNLVAGYKRAANILKKEGVDGIDSIQLSYTAEPAEKALIDALDAAGPQAAAAVADEDFGGAMAALASLRGPIDRFFDEVTVNDADPDKRAYRLSLLARLRDAVHGVADFSRIEG